MTENIDRRILGGFRCVDAITGNSIVDPLPARSAQLVVRPNRSGVYAIFDGPDLSGLTTQFVPATDTWPPAQLFEISIHDPRRRYLPRRFQVQTPQSVQPLNDPSSILHPQKISLYRGPAASVEPNWAVIHAAVVRDGAPAQGLPWTVLRVLRDSDHAVIATGLADERGEALLAVPGVGVQVSANGGGAVLQSTVAVTVEAFFDPGVSGQPPGWIPNPDDILGNLGGPWKTSSQAGQLGAGRTLSLTLTISI